MYDNKKNKIEIVVGIKMPFANIGYVTTGRGLFLQIKLNPKTIIL